MILRRRPGRAVPSWIITFADMVLILLVFFAMMLSFSSLDLQRYRSMAEAMNYAINDAVGGRLDPAALGQAGRQEVFSDDPADTSEFNRRAGAEDEANAEEVREQDVRGREGPEEMTETYESLKSVLDEEVAEGRVQVDLEDGVVVVRFQESPFFASGSEVLLAKFKEVIAAIVPVLAASEGDIVVQGHTDDVPITTAKFRSNWDLSTARANSMVHELLASPSIVPARVVSQGHADTKPLAANTSDENRARNRRVEMHVRRPES